MINLRVLPIGQKIALTERWLHEDRDVFEKIPVISGLIALVEVAHKELVSAKVQLAQSQSTKALSEALAGFDHSHDQIIRALWYGLEAAACAHDVPGGEAHPQTEAITALRDAMMSEGLSLTLRPYLEQVGNARKMAAERSQAEWEMLESIRIGNTNAAALLRLLVAVAERMSDALNKKVMLESKKTDGGVVNAAQIQWINNVRAVLQVLEVTDAPDDLKARLITHMAEASQAQLQRQASQAKPPEAAPDNGAAGPPRPLRDDEGGSAAPA